MDNNDIGIVILFMGFILMIGILVHENTIFFIIGAISFLGGYGVILFSSDSKDDKNKESET